MATRIYEHHKSINIEGNKRNTNYRLGVDEKDLVFPIIAKGNVYQGIIAQW